MCTSYYVHYIIPKFCIQCLNIKHHKINLIVNYLAYLSILGFVLNVDNASTNALK